MEKKDVKDIVWSEIREIWAETDRRWAKQKEEADRQLALRREEDDRRWAKQKEEADRRQEEADRRQEEADRRQEEADRRQEEADRRQEEADRRQKEADRRQEEADQRREEDERYWARRREEDERRWAEADQRSKKLDEKLDKIGEKLGGVESNIGFHAEQFFQNTLAETLTFGNEKYEDIYPNLKSMKKNADVEFDIVLVNGESVAIIEVKNRIHPKFVKDLVEKRLAMFRKTFSLFQNHKAYLGIAGFSFDDAVIKEAKEYGVGIIKQVGESIEAETGHLKAY